MTGLLQQLLDLATAHPSILGLIVLLSAAAESVVVVGALFPGTSIVLALAGVAGAAHADIWLLSLWAAVGAIIGDGVSYWIGHRYGEQLRRVWPFKQRPELLERGAAFFDRHGGKSVFFARFLPGVRAVVPVTAGMLGMTATRFYAANAGSAAVWAVSHVLPAAGIGVAFVTLGNMSGRLALFSGIVLICALLAFWLARVTIRRLAPMAALAYKGAVARLSERPAPLSRRLARILDPARPRLASFALWSAVLLVAIVGFLGVLEDLVAGDPLVRVDTAINQLAQSLRTPFGDAVMTVITSLGDTVVTGGLAVIVISWLSLRRAFAAAGAVALTMSVSAVFVFVMKAVIHKPRPIGIYGGADAFSFPSGHATFATVLYGVVAVLVSRSLPRGMQIVVFTFAGIGAVAVGLSRIYLSAHWPSDVLGGLLFGVGMTAIFALVFEHLPAERIGRAGLAAVVVATFAVLGTWHTSNSFQESLARYARQATQTTLDLDNWYRKGWQDLPAYRTDLAGETEEPITVQWAGDAGQLAAILNNTGWRAARPWSARAAIQFLNPAAPLSALPPLPLLNDGRFPILTMIRPIAPANERRLVFRLWSSPTVLAKDNIRTPILIGSVTLEEITHPFGFITTLRDRNPTDSTRSAFGAALHASKTINTFAPTGGTWQSAPILALPKGSLLGTRAGQANPNPSRVTPDTSRSRRARS